MGAGASLPACDSLPLMHKRRANAVRGAIADQNGHVVQLSSHAHLAAGVLYVNEEPTVESASAEAPLWMRDHLVLLYDGLCDKPAGERKATKTRRSKGLTKSSAPPTRDIHGTAADGKAEGVPLDAVVAMFHGFFSIAEHQHLARLKQQDYPF
jgi:hypothetical protein